MYWQQHGGESLDTMTSGYNNIQVLVTQCVVSKPCLREYRLNAYDAHFVNGIIS